MTETLTKLPAALAPPDLRLVAAKGCYVYAYIRQDLSPYYIGIAKYWRRPLAAHSCAIPADRRLIRVFRAGLTWQQAAQWEAFYVARYGRKDIGTGILRNLTDGGDGAPGRVKTPEEIEAIRQCRLSMGLEERARRASIQRRIEAEKKALLLQQLAISAEELDELRKDRKRETNRAHEARRSPRPFLGRDAGQKERNADAQRNRRKRLKEQGLPTYPPRSPEQKLRQAEAARRYRANVKARALTQ